jgi:hypothetical protein
VTCQSISENAQPPLDKQGGERQPQRVEMCRTRPAPGSAEMGFSLYLLLVRFAKLNLMCEE